MLPADGQSDARLGLPAPFHTQFQQLPDTICIEHMKEPEWHWRFTRWKAC